MPVPLGWYPNCLTPQAALWTGIYPINTQYIRCIWGWLLRVPSQGYHQFPYDFKPPKKISQAESWKGVGVSHGVSVAQVVNKGFDPPTNNAVISEGRVRNFLGRRSGRLLVSLEWKVEGGKKRVGPYLFYTLPETDSSPLKMDGWKMILTFWGPSYFQGLLLLALGSGYFLSIPIPHVVLVLLGGHTGQRCNYLCQGRSTPIISI